MRFRPLDALTLGYLGTVCLLIVSWPERVPDWLLLLGGFVAYGLAIVGVVALASRYPHHRGVLFLRWLYPLIMALGVYSAVERYAVVLRGAYLDEAMIAWESSVLGGQPNLYLGRFASPPLTELLSLCYFGFYPLLLVTPLVLFFRRRYRDLERLMTAVMLASYLCYLGYLVVPLRGPLASLHGSFMPAELPGYVITPLLGFIMAHGDIVTYGDFAGTCFPSAHVAAGWVCLGTLGVLYGRRVFLTLLPMVVGLTVATVYLRYHYLSDLVAGLAVAAVCAIILGILGGRQPRTAPLVAEPGEPVHEGAG